MFFSDFADWSAPAACEACGRTVDEEVSLNNAVCLGLEECAEGETCFDQPPNQMAGIYSDSDCDICLPGGVQVLAENFNLGGPASIDVLRFWGFYDPDVPLTNDQFTVVFWDTAAGGDLPLNIIREYPPTACHDADRDGQPNRGSRRVRVHDRSRARPGVAAGRLLGRDLQRHERLPLGLR